MSKIRIYKLARELDLTSGELDQKGIVSNAYLLEVASPGLDRPLVKRSDYERFSGEEIKIKTYAALDGQKTFQGILEGLKGDDVEIRIQDKLMRIPLDGISKANLVPDI